MGPLDHRFQPLPGQFTAHDFTGELEAANIRISLDGRGRVSDIIFVERVLRTVKDEDIYIAEYATVPALAAGLDVFCNLYNYVLPRQSLSYATPADVHFTVGHASGGVSLFT